MVRISRTLVRNEQVRELKKQGKSLIDIGQELKMYVYESTCIRCGRPAYSLFRHPKSPTQPLRKYCDSCISNLHKGKSANNRIKGKRYVNKHGYVNIRMNGHFRPEHRVVMEGYLGRPLRKGEVVHHIDGNPGNNRIENLELWIVPHFAGIKASDLCCPHCGKSYLLKENPMQMCITSQRTRVS